MNQRPATRYDADKTVKREEPKIKGQQVDSLNNKLRPRTDRRTKSKRKRRMMSMRAAPRLIHVW